jgi:hypothetical protein
MRLIKHKRRRIALVFRGEIVDIGGKQWVITGYDATNRLVHVARDKVLHTVLAEDIGLAWEDQDAAA